MKAPALASPSFVNSVGSWAVKSAWKVVWEKALHSQFACLPDIRKLIETTSSQPVLSHVLTQLELVAQNLDLHCPAHAWKTIAGRSLSKFIFTRFGQNPPEPKPINRPRLNLCASGRHSQPAWP